MKLRNKLIPILSIGTVAVATPVALTTSCGFSLDAIIDVPSHNMLKEYENHVIPLAAKTIVGADTDIGKQYINEVSYNTDALKDDIMFTIATCLTKAKSTIETTYKFTKYQLNVRDISVGTNKNLYFTLESKMAGELVTPTKIGTKTIKSFNMYFQAWLEDGWTAEYNKKVESGAFKNQHTFTLTPVNALTAATLHVYGWGTYTEDGKTATNDCRIDQVIKNPTVHKDDYAAWPLFNAIYSIPASVIDLTITKSFVIASPYLRNTNIEVK